MSTLQPSRRRRTAAHRPHDKLRRLIDRTVALAFELPQDALRGPTRGHADAALARQASMYLAHTVCGLSLTQTGELFDRDRTTVAHACTLVEQRREQPEFDHAIELLESIVLLLTGPGGICPPGDVPNGADDSREVA